MIFLNQEFTGQTNSAMCILRFGNHDIQHINIFVPFKNISQVFATDLHIIFLFRKIGYADTQFAIFCKEVYVMCGNHNCTQ